MSKSLKDLIDASGPAGKLGERDLEAIRQAWEIMKVEAFKGQGSQAPSLKDIGTVIEFSRDRRTWMTGVYSGFSQHGYARLRNDGSLEFYAYARTSTEL